MTLKYNSEHQNKQQIIKVAIVGYRSNKFVDQDRCTKLDFTKNISKIENHLDQLLSELRFENTELSLYDGIQLACDLDWSSGNRKIIHITSEIIPSNVKFPPWLIKSIGCYLRKPGHYFYLEIFENNKHIFQHFERLKKDKKYNLKPKHLYCVHYDSHYKIKKLLPDLIKPNKIDDFPPIPSPKIDRNFGNKDKKNEKQTNYDISGLEIKQFNFIDNTGNKKKKNKFDGVWMMDQEATVYYVDRKKTDFEKVMLGEAEVVLGTINKKFNIEINDFSKGNCRTAHNMKNDDEHEFVAKFYRKKYLEKIGAHNKNQNVNTVGDNSKGKRKGKGKGKSKSSSNTYLNSDEFFEHCKIELTLSYLAKEMAARFNSQNPFKSIDYLSGFICKIQRDSSNEEFFPHFGSANNDFLIFNAEPKLKGKWIKYSNNYLTKTQRDSYTSIYAFSHFSYINSGKNIMVTDLQGVKNVLTDPSIHSINNKTAFSPLDFGQRGADSFFKTHLCSVTCKNILELERHPLSKDIELKNATSVFHPFELACANIFCSNTVTIKVNEVSSQIKKNQRNYMKHKLYFCQMCKSKNLNELGEK